MFLLYTLFIVCIINIKNSINLMCVLCMRKEGAKVTTAQQKRKEYMQAYQKANKERIKEYRREYYRTHKEKCLMYSKKWRSEHPEKSAEYQQRYWAKKAEQGVANAKAD